MSDESEYDRFMRLSEAIANNIPDKHGNELGYLLLEAAGDDGFKLALGLTAWLIQLGMDESEAFACYKAAVNISFQKVFNPDLTDID